MRTAVLLIGGLALAGANTPLTAGPLSLPSVALPAAYEAQNAPTSTLPLIDRWWEGFGDPLLDQLVGRVLASNTTIAEARARLNAARADARLTAAAAKPQVGLDAGAGQAGGPLINAAGGSGSLFTARASLSWEIDLAGRLSDNKTAARLDAVAAEALLEHARLLAVVETVQAYTRAQFLEADAAIKRERVALGERQLARTRQRQDHGLATAGLVAEEAAALSQTRGDLVEIERLHATVNHQLQYLSGSSDPLPIAPLALAAPPDVPAGLPSELLTRRPDIAAAEAQFRAADKRLASARKSWLPSFSLTASGGAASPSLGQILASSAQSFGLNLLFALPLFDGGRHKALVGHRQAELEVAAAQYGSKVLGALREVNDALTRSSAARLQSSAAADRLALALQVYGSAKSASDHGLQSAVAVDSRLEAALACREAALMAQFEGFDATFELIRSLGGGWHVQPNG